MHNDDYKHNIVRGEYSNCFSFELLNKSAKWHCGRHTLWLKKYMNDVWSVVLKNKNF